MTPHLDFARIQIALTLLGDCGPDAQVLQLKNLCENNGTWPIHDDGSRYKPVLYEISLFGVPALADDIAELPRNWTRAARNILTALSEVNAA